MNCFGLNARNCGVYRVIVEVDEPSGTLVNTLETSLLDEETGEFRGIHFPNPRFRVQPKESIHAIAPSGPLDTTKKTAKICVCGAGWWSQGWHLPQLDNNPKVEIVA